MNDKKQWVTDVLSQCTQHGYRTTPVFSDGKAKPFADGQDYKDVMAYKGCAHIGLVLDDLILVDYDGNKSDDIISVDELADELNEFEMPDIIQRREDSIHWLYLSDGRDLRNSNDGKRWAHIDIKTGNQLMHIKQGKKLNLVGRDDLLPAPEALYKALSKTVSGVAEVDSELGDFAGLIDENDTPVEKVREWLESLDPDMGGYDWVNVGAALHDWNSGVEGLTLWVEWSRQSDKFKEGECEKRWARFEKGAGVSLGTLVHMAKEAEYEESKKLLAEIESAIKKAEQSDLETSIPKMVSRSSLTALEVEVVSKRYQERFKELTGVRLPISEVRALLKPKVHVGELVDDAEKPRWCRNWVYVNSHGAFAHMKSGEICKAEAFNVKNGKYVPIGEGGSKQSAVKFVSDSGYVDIVSSIAYMPTCDSVICELDGMKVLNSFRPESVPVEADSFTDDGLKAIELTKRHFKLLCGSEENAEILTQWLAFQVQRQGEKILWAPVIQSIEGVGKSFVTEFMQRILGYRNVGVVNPTQAVSQYNGWATGVTLNVLEEISVKGHNRYEAINALKPLITDSTIQITDKHVKAFRTLNTANYICFTNHKDALPLSQNDRRWWIIFVEFDSLKEMVETVGESVTSYFPKLFDSMRENAMELRKWLLEYPLTEEFLSMKQAPMTVHKEMLIATEEASFEGVDELKELIEGGGKYYNKDVISTADLFSDFSNKYFDIVLHDRGKATLLKKLGYTKHPKRVKIDGETRRIWVKKAMTNEQIRKSFMK